MRSHTPKRRRSRHVAGYSVAAVLLLSPYVARAQAKMTQPFIRVVGTDYALVAPDTVAAGPTTFQFENRGVKKHELAVVLARRGTTAAQIVAAAQAGLPAPRLAEAYSDGSPLGALFAAPGERSRATLVASLERGRLYVLVCTLRDTPTMSEHAALGMFHVVYVR